MRNQQDLQERLAASAKREEALKASLADQEQMLRDMTFHFESQIRILQEGGGSGGASELEGGAVIAPLLDERQGGGNSRGKRKAKKG